jgi:outer membrane protein TolC
MRSMLIAFFCLAFGLAAVTPAFTEDAIATGAGELVLSDLLKALAAASPDLKKEEAALFKAHSGFQEQMAFLYPSIYFTLPSTFSYSPVFNFSATSSYSLSVRDGSLWDFSPGLSLTQALPTSGRLDVSVKDTLSLINLGDPVQALPPGITVPDTAYTHTLTFGLSLTQPIFFEDAFSASIAVIEQTYRLAQARYLFAKNTLVAQAARAYYGLVRLKTAERLAKLTLAAEQQGLADVKRKLDAGSTTRAALLKAEARSKKAELDFYDASQALRNEYRRLAAAYHLPENFSVGDETAPLVLPALPAAADIRSRVAAGNPELAMGRNELEAKKARVTTTKCENADTLTLGSSLMLDSVNSYQTDLLEALADPFDSSANPRLAFSLKLSFRIFDGGAAAEKVKQAAYDAEMSALALESRETELGARIDGALASLERSRLNVGYAEAALAAAAQDFDAAGRDYKLGQIAVLDLNRLELAFRAAGLESLQAKSERDLALLELFALMGDDLFALLNGGKPA